MSWISDRAIERLREIHQFDIAVRRVLSPREFKNDMHLYAGALYGLSPLASPAAMFSSGTPIQGLYLAGQTTWPGFGVASAGISGLLAAELLMRDGLR